jgi:hypothetical protein
MGTKLRKVMCDEHGIGGSAEFCGANDAHLGRMHVFYHEALGGKYAAGHFVSPTRGRKLGQRRPLIHG